MSIPDGDPIPMSEFTLGEPYTSSDMYRDMGLRPGDTVAFEKDGVVYTDTIQEVTYTSPAPTTYPDLSWWQKTVRRFTPARFRKPIKPVRCGEPSKVTVTVGDHNPLKRAGHTIADIQKMMDGFH